MKWEYGNTWKCLGKVVYAPLLMYGGKARFPRRRFRDKWTANNYGNSLVRRANRLGVKWK